MIKKCLVVVCVAMVCLFVAAASKADVRNVLTGELQSQLPIAGEQLVSEELVSYFYAQRDYHFAWQNYRSLPALLATIKDSYYEGLRPQDYHLTALTQLYALQESGQATSRQREQFDVLMTDAVVTYAQHLINGKVNPRSLSSDWDYSQRDIEAATAALALSQHIKQGSLEKALQGLTQGFAGYMELKQMLKHYLALQHAKPFKPLSVTANELKAGVRHAGVFALAERLIDEGDLAERYRPTSNVFTKQIFEALKTYQLRYQLTASGIVDKATLEQLNRPYSELVNTVRANIERARWVSHTDATELIVVNIPSYKLYYYRNGERVWQTHVVVGADQTKTPIFTRQLRYIEFNPTWTVPRSIIPSIIEKTKNDFAYFKDRKYYLVDSKGARVEGDQVDWSKLSKNHFPYWIVQRPWQNNSLGQVKFMFPNEHAVYLHDTPAKGLFDVKSRAFSHGCIRVNQPMKLAEVILGEQGYDQSKINDVLASEQTTRVNVSRSIQVLLMYWTAFQVDGQYQFYDDIYGRDQALIDALVSPI